MQKAISIVNIILNLANRVVVNSFGNKQTHPPTVLMIAEARNSRSLQFFIKKALAAVMKR